MTISPDLLRLELAESLAAPTPALTRRDVHLPGIPGKAFAVIGVRLAKGSPAEAQLFLALEDERLAGLAVDDLRWLLDEHARQLPALAAAERWKCSCILSASARRCGTPVRSPLVRTSGSTQPSARRSTSGCAATWPRAAFPRRRGPTRATGPRCSRATWTWWCYAT